MKTRIYLDVDGCTNPYMFRGDEKPWEDLTLHENINGFPVYGSHLLGAALLEISRDIVWLTTWQGDADRWIAPLMGLPQGLRHLPLITHWKRDALLLDQKASPCPFIWIDDDSATRFSFRETIMPHLIIEPLPHLGITAAQIKEMHEFAKDY